jgi:excinuclease ABC subunit C
MERSQLDQQLEALPAKPGVYLFKDEKDNVLYVGKAASLYHRVLSYFGSSNTVSAKTERLMTQVRDFDFYVTNSEQEAILLESSLIKRYRPRYNVRLKDDKSYPYLKVSMNEDWPRAYVTRRMERDGARYFGPFSSAGALRKTLSLLKTLFPLRQCRETVTGMRSRPCLEYDIHRCLGPCVGEVSREEYRRVAREVILFLEGRHDQVLKELRKSMTLAADRLEFEKAAAIREQIKAVERVMEEQNVASLRGEVDVIAFAQSGDQACVMVLFVRQGKVVGRENFVLTGAQEEEPARIITSFVQQYYGSASHIPRRILLQHALEDTTLISEWLTSRRGSRVRLGIPRRGALKGLVDMVAENARECLEQTRIRSLSSGGTLTEALVQLQKELELPQFPERIECYDISNIQGAHAVGSMVVFEKGLPRKSHYRLFKIKSVAGADDYAMLQEVLRRRFRRSAGSAEGVWSAKPDLILIDGGRGQLNAALEVMEVLGTGVPCASIAKEHEEIFVPWMSESVRLPRQSLALQLVQRIRDEAHRFALGYYRRLHRRESLGSSLDDVPGVGEKRRRALLKKFGSVRAIRQAQLGELAEVEGMTMSAARKIKEYM